MVEAILISIIIALLRGGKLKGFRSINGRTMWLFLFGVVIQYILAFLNTVEGIDSINRLLLYNKEILIVSYVIIGIGILGNIKFKSMWLMLVGFLMNFAALSLNGWKIPILSEGLKILNGFDISTIIGRGELSLYVPITAATKYPGLGEIIVFADPYPIPTIISLGDLVVSFAIFALIQELMMKEGSLFKNI